MCRVLKIARAGYYAWLHEPESGRTIEDKRLLQLIRFLMMPVMASMVIVASRWILKS
jgi:lactate dehydrogenase-like 2-hydroxyacid dehydrogenase